MNQMMKKAMAAALSLTLVTGVAPITCEGVNLLKPSIVANAEGESVNNLYVQVQLSESINLGFRTDEFANLSGAKSVKLSGPNGDIVYNYVELPDDTRDYIIEGTDGESIGAYCFRYQLYANQLDEDVTIQFFADENAEGSIVPIKKQDNSTVDSFTYSVNDYCDSLIGDDAKYDSATEEANAISSLKNLGIAVDNYFNNNDIAIAFIDEAAAAAALESTYFAPVFFSDNDKISLVLDSVFSIRFYIDGLTDTSTATNWGDVEINTVKGQDDRYCFEQNILSPSYMDGSFAITYNGNIYEASVLSWCHRAIGSANENTQKLAKAIYEYSNYIEEYDAWYYNAQNSND